MGEDTLILILGGFKACATAGGGRSGGAHGLREEPGKGTMGADDFEEKDGEDADGEVMRQKVEKEGAEQKRIRKERMELLECLEGCSDDGHL